MIRFEYNAKTQHLAAETNGNLAEIVSDIALCVSVAYNLIRGQSPQAADEFQRAMCAVFTPDSPVWSAEDVPDPEDGVKMVRIAKHQEEGSHERADV